MCLTWKVINSSLTLACKTPSLLFVVSLYDPLNTEAGFCLPPIPSIRCHSLLKNLRIHQNIKTNETFFYVTGTIDKRMNGNWTCRYGRFSESATEVTLPNSQGNS